MVIHLVAQGVLGPDLAQFQTAPLAEVANRIFGPMMPRVFAWVHSRYGTPAMAIVTYAVLACLLALFGGFTRLAISSSVSTLLMDLGVVLASVRLRRLGVEADQPPVRLPGALLIPAIAAIATAEKPGLLRSRRMAQRRS